MASDPITLLKNIANADILTSMLESPEIFNSVCRFFRSSVDVDLRARVASAAVSALRRVLTPAQGSRPSEILVQATPFYWTSPYP
ncbi:hypothetical protein GNI_201270, partial [Gregarina niphandrodes]